MNISEVMTKAPTCAQPDTGIEEIARQMLTCDCGCLPVVDAGRIVGILTDRDIVVRAVAAGKNGSDIHAKDVMSHPVAVLASSDDICQAYKLMEENKIRRAPVVDDSNRLVGIVSLSDLARVSTGIQVGSLIQNVTQPMDIGHE